MANLRIAFVLEPSLHSATLLSEFMLSCRLEVDVVICGSLKLTGRRESTEALIPELEGEVTAIISALENIGRVVFMDSVVKNDSLTATSANIEGKVVEIARSLYVTGSFEESIDAEDIMKRTKLLVSKDDATHFPGLLLLAPNATKLIGSYSGPLLQCRRTVASPEDPVAEDLLIETPESRDVLIESMWNSGNFSIAELAAFPGGADDDGGLSSSPRIHWKVVRQFRGCVDTRRLVELPLPL